MSSPRTIWKITYANKAQVDSRTIRVTHLSVLAPDLTDRPGRPWGSGTLDVRGVDVPDRGTRSHATARQAMEGHSSPRPPGLFRGPDARGRPAHPVFPTKTNEASDDHPSHSRITWWAGRAEPGLRLIERLRASTVRLTIHIGRPGRPEVLDVRYVSASREADSRRSDADLAG